MSKRMITRLVYAAVAVGIYAVAPYVVGAEEAVRMIAAAVFGWSLPSDQLPGMKS